MLDRLPAAGVAAIVGWCLGWASAWLSARLEPPAPSPPGAPTDAPASAGPLHAFLPDPLVQGLAALVGAAIALFMSGDWLRWGEAGLLALPLIQVAVTDLRTSYVYTVVAVTGAALGLAFGWQVHQVEWWTGLVGAAGGAVGFGALHLLGRLMYRGRVEAMARGDIGIAAMVGAGAAACAAQALFLGVLVGGVLAVGVLIATRSRQGFMPYGPGLCLGGLATLFLC